MNFELTLQYPVTVDGKTTESLSFRRPKVRDIKKLQAGKGSEADRSIALIVDLAEVPPAVIDELDPIDFAAINAWLEPILDPQASPAG